MKTVRLEALMQSSKPTLILQIEAIEELNIFLELKLFMKTVLCFFKLEPLEPHKAYLKNFSASNRRLKATGDKS